MLAHILAKQSKIMKPELSTLPEVNYLPLGFPSLPTCTAPVFGGGGAAPGIASMPCEGLKLVGFVGRLLRALTPKLSCSDLAIRDCRKIPKTTMTTIAISSNLV